MNRILTWLENKFFAGKAASSKQTPQPGRRTRPASVRAKPSTIRPAKNSDMVELSLGSVGSIEDAGPGKNVLIRNKYLREDTGTHETLKIIDDSILQSEEEDGFDPYNTGQFDRSKSWNLRNRK